MRKLENLKRKPCLHGARLCMYLCKKEAPLEESMSRLWAGDRRRLQGAESYFGMCVCVACDACALRAILPEGANPVIRDTRGQTPLHSAALAGCADATRLLLAKGADPYMRDERRASSRGLHRK